MPTAANQVQNPACLWAFRLAMAIALLINIPLALYSIYESAAIASPALHMLFHCYLAPVSYVLGFRLDNPPDWSRRFVPKRWIAECRYLVYTDPTVIKANRNKLLQFAGGIVLLLILLLSVWYGRF